MIFFGTIFCVGLFWYGWRWPRNGDAALQEARKQAETQYADLVVPSNNPRLVFKGATAKVLSVKVRASGFGVGEGKTGSYVVTRYACNEYGEYFMILSGTDRFFKRIPPNLAKIVLKL